MSTALVLKNRDTFLALGKIQTEALAILGDSAASDFEKGYVAACAMSQLKAALTDEIMRPIAALQGSPLGFLTDKDRDGGYPIEIVREAAITAVLSGLRFHGNEWNIIGGRCYVTVNGCDRLMSQVCSEPAEHTPGEVTYDEAAKRAHVDYTVKYRLKGNAEPTSITQRVSVKLQYTRTGQLVTTDDAVIGKARRKVLWSILRSLKGIEISEGEMEAPPRERNVTPRPAPTQAEATPQPFALEAAPSEG
jgi:hypothetical protein